MAGKVFRVPSPQRVPLVSYSTGEVGDMSTVPRWGLRYTCPDATAILSDFL